MSNGLFTVTLDFGASAFDGNARWLAVEVRTNGSLSAYTPLMPRQRVWPTPYAMYSASAAGLTGNPTLTGTVTFSPASGPPFAVGSSTKVDKLNADLLDGLDSIDFAPTAHGHHDVYWRLLGNSGTSAGVHFLGTTDDEPLELKVYGQRAFRFEPTTQSPNLVGGYAGNYVSSEVGATISGGGTAGAVNAISSEGWSTIGYNTIGGGSDNRVAGAADFCSVGGGHGNLISGYSYATIGGGSHNAISQWLQSAYHSATISGGENNLITFGRCVAIGGGSRNQADASYSIIGGGQGNRIYGGDFIKILDPDFSTIGGGIGNSIGFSCSGSTIAGGSQNQVVFSIYRGGDPVISAAIGGGRSNLVENARFGTVSGGANNTATNHYATIAGGGGANTVGSFASYCYIGGGSRNRIAGLNQTYVEHCVISGGYSNSISRTMGPRSRYGCIPGGYMNSVMADYSLAAGCRAKANHTGSFVWADGSACDFVSINTNSFSARCTGGARFVSGLDGSCNPLTGVVLQPNSGSWSSLSDRNAKEAVEPVASREILEALASVPMSIWSYKGQGQTRHIGPMAQDFAAAFKVGEDDRTISTVDADGVALAAIQGLNEIVKEQKAELDAKEARITALERSLAKVQAVLSILEQKSNGGAQ